MSVTPSDVPIATVEVARGVVSYADQGAGPPVLAVHGLPGTHRDYRYLAGALADRCRLIRPDMPGFGDTAGDVAADVSVGARAEVLRELLDALQVPSVIAVGHSMGAALVAELARCHPDRVTALALLAGPGKRPHRA